MSDNKGLSDQELLKLCRSGGPITNEDIGGKTQSGSDITYLNESGMHRAAKYYGINIMLEEEHYVDMDFGEALNLCKNGNKIARSGWNGKNMFVVYQKGYPEGIPCNLQTAEAWGMNEGDNFICNPYLQIKNADGSHSMWAPSTGDCLANDWYVVY